MKTAAVAFLLVMTSLLGGFGMTLLVVSLQLVRDRAPPAEVWPGFMGTFAVLCAVAHFVPKAARMLAGGCTEVKPEDAP